MTCMRYLQDCSLLPQTDAEGREVLRTFMRFAFHDLQHATMDPVITNGVEDLRLTQLAWNQKGFLLDS